MIRQASDTICCRSCSYEQESGAGPADWPAAAAAVQAGREAGHSGRAGEPVHTSAAALRAESGAAGSHPVRREQLKGEAVHTAGAGEGRQHPGIGLKHFIAGYVHRRVTLFDYLAYPRYSMIAVLLPYTVFMTVSSVSA